MRQDVVLSFIVQMYAVFYRAIERGVMVGLIDSLSHTCAVLLNGDIWQR